MNYFKNNWFITDKSEYIIDKNKLKYIGTFNKNKSIAIYYDYYNIQSSNQQWTIKLLNVSNEVNIFQ